MTFMLIAPAAKVARLGINCDIGDHAWCHGGKRHWYCTCPCHEHSTTPTNNERTTRAQALSAPQ